MKTKENKLVKKVKTFNDSLVNSSSTFSENCSDMAIVIFAKLFLPTNTYFFVLLLENKS